MRELSIEEVKTIQLQILDVTADFCKKNNIQYWLDSGTLLGAIRHNGYIPWDDDIDLGMLRPDFDRFLSLFNRENTRYKAYCIENNNDFYYPHAKVLDCTTTLYEPDENGLKLSVNIDVFVYDNAPDNDTLLARMYDRRDFLQKWHLRRNIGRPHGSPFQKTAMRIVFAFLHIFPASYFVKKMVANSKRFCNESTKRVGNFTSYSRIACDKHIFDSFTEHVFEGKSYSIPVGYDEWLQAFYGNYMELPPLEKRVSHHEFKVFDSN